jgi:hypothetical protein
MVAVRKNRRARSDAPYQNSPPSASPGFFQLPHRWDRNKVETMKAFAFITAIFATASTCFADFTNSPENFSPHFPTDAKILWQASTNNLPKGFWIYRRLPPHPFSATIISNAIVLASLQSKGFPKPSTNDFYIAEDKGPNYPGGIPVIFSISPKSATISYGMPHTDTNQLGIPADEVLVRHAWACARELGVDPAQVAFKDMTSRFNQDENYNDLTNQLCGRGVFLSRQLDGILFTSVGDNSANGGFWIEFGSHEQIHAFSLVWPDLKRDKFQQTASPEQIIACIRAQKTIVIPNANEEKYFERVRTLANAKTFTITKITPSYNEGVFGEMPKNDTPPEFIAPFAELEAVADFGKSNATVRLVSPIISSDVTRLLAK